MLYEKNVLFLNTPANSPDLHPIEHLHKDEKRLSKEYRMAINGTRTAIQLEAKRWIEAL